MAIEVSVRKEIKEYQEKLIFGLSLRQAACAVAAIVFSVVIGVFNHFVLKLSIDDVGLLIMFLNIPVLSIGWFKKEGMPVEKYIKVVRKYRSLTAELPYKNEALEVEKVECDDKKEAKRRKEYGN